MSKKNPLKTKKNQHYVPQSYLRRFTIKGEKSLIWKFDKKNNEYNKYPASVNKICAKPYYYYQQDGDGFEHIRLEDEISKVEKIGNDIIIKIINNVDTNKPYVSISEKERGEFAFYVSFMLTRNPAFRDGINQVNAQLLLIIINNMYGSGKLPEPPAILKKAIDEKGFDNVIKTQVFASVSLEPMIKLAEDIGVSMLAKNFYFLVAPVDLEFITNDNPVSFMSASGLVTYLGPAHQDAMIVFPISKKIALIIQGSRSQNDMSICTCQEEAVKLINQHTANAANEFIFCSTKYDWLADIITNKTGQKIVVDTHNTGYEIVNDPYKEILSKEKQKNHEQRYKREFELEIT
jgi:hypothetical protein